MLSDLHSKDELRLLKLTHNIDFFHKRKYTLTHIKFEFVYNNDYATTNNIYSLYLAREQLVSLFSCDCSRCVSISKSTSTKSLVPPTFCLHPEIRANTYILFGCGMIGKEALEYFGAENVFCFVDNDPAKVGKRVRGKEVISAQHLLEIYSKYKIVITTEPFNAQAIEMQLIKMGIQEYFLLRESLVRQKIFRIFSIFC
mgnify:CR=1 FL=1